MLYILLAVVLFLILFVPSTYILARNSWVLHNRIDLLIEDRETYKLVCRYITYNEMLFKYPFVWDFDKFIDRAKEIDDDL